MALIKSVRGMTPALGKNCYLAETAVMIGDVIAGDNCSSWFNTVIASDYIMYAGWYKQEE